MVAVAAAVAKPNVDMRSALMKWNVTLHPRGSEALMMFGNLVFWCTHIDPVQEIQSAHGRVVQPFPPLALESSI